MCQCGSVDNHLNKTSVHHEDYFVGIDLAENVFQTHGIDQHGKVS